jgi:rhodanese-related sulfurtransferase/DNA-binding transcriptional ArsR family regulator
MSHREFKDPLYAHFARIGHALSSPTRLELLDLISQGEMTVERLADQAQSSVKNTSAHLRVLREARLVTTRRVGTHIYYRLTGDDVFRLVQAVQDTARNRLAEVEQITQLYLTSRDQLVPVAFDDLRRLVRDDLVTVIDARPREEYEAGHIPGALSIPVSELERRFKEIPRAREVIAYCRGPYCVYALDAVTQLRKRGYRARRAADGFPAWRNAGLPVQAGPAAGPDGAAERRRTRRSLR